MVTPIWQMDTLRLEKDEVLNGEAEGEEAPQLDPGVGLGSVPNLKGGGGQGGQFPREKAPVRRQLQNAHWMEGASICVLPGPWSTTRSLQLLSAAGRRGRGQSGRQSADSLGRTTPCHWILEEPW